MRGILIYCSDYQCSHSVSLNADRWPDDVRLSDIEGSARLAAIAARMCGPIGSLKLSRARGEKAPFARKGLPFSRCTRNQRASCRLRKPEMPNSSTDHCPHCGSALEIIFLKFRPGRTAMVTTCPNCAIVFADDGRGLAEITRQFQTIEVVMDWLNKRFRYILAFLLAAVVVAALLRHGFHVYGGFSREEIREDALLALPDVVLLVVLFRRRR